MVKKPLAIMTRQDCESMLLRLLWMLTLIVMLLAKLTNSMAETTEKSQCKFEARSICNKAFKKHQKVKLYKRCWQRKFSECYEERITGPGTVKQEWNRYSQGCRTEEKSENVCINEQGGNSNCFVIVYDAYIC